MQDTGALDDSFTPDPGDNNENIPTDSTGIDGNGGDTPEEITGPFDFLKEIFSNVFVQRIIISVIIFIIVNLLRVFISRLLHKKYHEDIKKYYRLKKLVSKILITIGIISIGSVWFAFFDQILTFLGIVSAGIAIALRDAVTNFAGWAFIVWRKPFEVGERVQLGQTAGDVIDIRIFQFTVMEIGNWVDADQSTGRIVQIPNGKIFTEHLANYSKGFNYIWNEIPVTVTFESNWKKAKDILTDIIYQQAEHISEDAEEKIKQASRKFMIFYNKLTPIVYTHVIDFGVTLTIRYMCHPQRRRTTENNVWEDILAEFAKTPDITFAYPTQRFFHNPIEGKIRKIPPSSPADKDINPSK
jgi:small-conductance mechanosensitive channel